MPNFSITSPKWLTIKSHLDHDPDLIHDMQIPCLLCYRTISLDPQNESDAKCPGLVIFPCGCVVGETCARKYLAETQWCDPVKKCPNCGTLVTHRNPRCRHQVILFPFRGLQDIEKVPKTLAEGGLIAHACLFCRLEEYIEVLGQEFQQHMPVWLRHGIEHQLMFPLITDWGLTFNMHCHMEALDERHDIPAFNFIGVSGPVYILSDDNRRVVDDGAPGLVLESQLLKVLTRRLRHLYELSHNRWTPKIIDMRIGIVRNDALDEAGMEALRECLATVHERSDLFSEYITDIEVGILRSFDDVRDQWSFRHETRPRSDINSDPDLNVDNRVTEVDSDQDSNVDGRRTRRRGSSRRNSDANDDSDLDSNSDAGRLDGDGDTFMDG